MNAWVNVCSCLLTSQEPVDHPSLDLRRTTFTPMQIIHNVKVICLFRGGVAASCRLGHLPDLQHSCPLGDKVGTGSREHDPQGCMSLSDNLEHSVSDGRSSGEYHGLLTPPIIIIADKE